MNKKAWYILYLMFASWLPVSYHFKFSKTARYWFGKKILKKCGSNVNIEKGAKFNELCSIGDNSGIGVDCELNGQVEIGDNVLMGPEVVVYTQNHQYSNPNRPIICQGYSLPKPVKIGNDVWIGRRAMLMPGVEIKRGCIVAAGAVVTKNFDDYSVIAGNPAVAVKTRK